jgi:hypothetical protein
VPYHVPFIRINEFVGDAIVANRFKDMGQASSLAAALATLISNGAPLTTLLQRIAVTIGGEAALLDIDGETMASWPPSTT